MAGEFRRYLSGAFRAPHKLPKTFRKKRDSTIFVPHPVPLKDDGIGQVFIHLLSFMGRESGVKGEKIDL